MVNRFYRGSALRFLFYPLLLILTLLGCDRQRIAELEEGVASEADVRARFGEPEKIWEAADMASLPLPGPLPGTLAQPGSRTL